MLSKTRGVEAAKTFLGCALKAVGKRQVSVRTGVAAEGGQRKTARLAPAGLEEAALFGLGEGYLT